VIKVGDTTITEAQFNEMYADFVKQQEGAPLPKRKTLAENYAGTLMLSQQATAQHLDKEPEIARKLEMNRLQILSDAEYERLEQQAKPNMQEIAAYYNAHLDEFDEVAIRRVFIYKQRPTTNGHGVPPVEAQAKAEEIRKVLASGGDATALIKDTKDAIDAEPLTFRRGDLPPFMAQAFDMKVGEWSQIVDNPEALVLFEVVKHDRLSLGQVTPVIEKKLQAQKLREEMDALKKSNGVWVDEEHFAGPVSAATSPDPGPSNGKRSQEKD
jgi:hypothetical protein